MTMNTCLRVVLGLGLGWLDTEVTDMTDAGFDDPDRLVGVTLLNASAQIFWGTDRASSLTAWGRNLTDEAYRTNYNDDGIYHLYTNWSEPRTYGLKLAYIY